MARYQLSDLKVIFIITKRMVDGAGNLQPANEENKLEDEEDWEEHVWFRVQVLVSNEREDEVGVCGDVHDLLRRNLLL